MITPNDPVLIRRFWSYVDRPTVSGCCLWLGATDRQGYGWFTWPGAGGSRRKCRAHRIALALTEPPGSDCLLCLHACDVPACCNPSHLRWGTASDNVRDRDRPERRCQLRIERLARQGLHPLPFGMPEGDPSMPTITDFENLDRHVLRVAHGSLLDNPLDAHPGAHEWIATMWRDQRQACGWSRLVWDRHPSGRGWTIHPMTHLGDVVEFGADGSSGMDRWYGYVAAADPTALEIVGPLPTPTDAGSDAAGSLASWRHQMVVGR